MTNFTPLVRIKLADQIVNQLRDAIDSRRYNPGDQLPSERELVSVFGASRVAVREALVTLQAQGLVERSHGRTARVALGRTRSWSGSEVIRLPENPSESDVQDVKQVRILLEIEMARIAAQTCSPTDVERLNGALEANRKAISDPRSFLETDMAMHRVIARISGNSLFVAISCDLLSWLARFQTEAVHVEGSVMLSYREHARIIEMIVVHDSDAAAMAMSEHLSRGHLAYGRLQSLQSPPAEMTLQRMTGLERASK